MDLLAITWKQKGAARWVGRDSDGYSLRVIESAGRWQWSLWPPGAGYAVSKGCAESRDEAILAVEASHRALLEQIRAALASRVPGKTGEKA